MQIRSGRTLEIIYLDRMGRLTQRKIYVKSVRDGFVFATCNATGTPKTFRVDSILSWQYVKTA